MSGCSFSVEEFLSDARSGAEMPAPGSGRTAERFAALRQQAAIDSSIGRLAESHADALAILREAGHEPPHAAALAVWASETGGSLIVRREECGFRLVGRKGFCGGATVVDSALITAHLESSDGVEPIMLLVPLRRPGIRIDPSVWNTPAFPDAGISLVEFDVVLDVGSVIGPPGFYTDRPGFWQGAVGVAATWAGIGDALVERAVFRADDSMATLARGEIAAHRWGIDAALAHAAAGIDASPNADAQPIALASRHVIARALDAILRLLDHETGPGPVAFDALWQRRRLELTLSLLQSHGRRDVASLAE